VWQGTWVFVADSQGTQAWRFSGGKLHAAWSNSSDGTSPVVAGGLLYVAGSGAVRVYLPTSGKLLATLQTGSVHWQSPIVAGGVLAMPEGNANDHATSGVLDLFR
jgi:outer membrane protein assembly factor BamB